MSKLDSELHAAQAKVKKLEEAITGFEAEAAKSSGELERVTDEDQAIAILAKATVARNRASATRAELASTQADVTALQRRLCEEEIAWLDREVKSVHAEIGPMLRELSTRLTYLTTTDDKLQAALAQHAGGTHHGSMYRGVADGLWQVATVMGYASESIGPGGRQLIWRGDEPTKQAKQPGTLGAAVKAMAVNLVGG